MRRTSKSIAIALQPTLLSTLLSTTNIIKRSTIAKTKSFMANGGETFNSRSPFTIGITVILLILIGLISFFVGLKVGSSPSSVATLDNRTSAPGSKASQTLNRTFSFGLKNDKGEIVSNFTYSLQDAQLQDEIIIKGEKARAIKGKTFLILDVKIDNQNKQGVQINTRDYIRLTVNGGKEWLAPEIHNDPVQAQAISVKYTRLGFPINDSDRNNLLLQIGEINGSKEEIKLNLK